MGIPVYLFTGFLEGGKTSIIQESLNDEKFNSGEKTLVLICEEGIEELDPSSFWGKNVTIKTIESEQEITKDFLQSLTDHKKVDRIIIEYNGMWQTSTLFNSFPRNWELYQNMMFADATTFISYNANMRQLVFDKLVNAEMIVLNRFNDNISKEEIHKIVRGISRRTAIVFEYEDRHIEYDDIEDPLPFSLDDPIIQISDEDYALWFRDLSENMKAYDGKTVKFKGIVAIDPRIEKNSFIIGRHIMTCCADDIAFGGMICRIDRDLKLKSRDWLTVTGRIKIETAKIYNAPGPVLYIESTEFAMPPQNEIATFY